MIKRVFDLSNLKEESDTEGIFNFPLNSKFSNKYISDNIRGEFVGYTSYLGFLRLIRDRVGGRNLYYKDMGNKIVVSTDILWVFNEGKRDLIPPDYFLDLNYINSDYLEFQVPFDNRTIYTNVMKVMPGEIVTFPDRKREKYWNLKFGENKFNKDDLLDLIIDAVNWRKGLLTDGKYTSYLSGGIDSSSITILSNPEESFSGFYEPEQYSELDYIKCLERRFRPVKITEDLFYRFFSHLPDLMPDPMGGFGVIPQLIVAMEAFRGGYHYAFTGEGGDEIFGYPWNYTIVEQVKNLRFLMERDKYLVGWDPMINKMLHHSFIGFTATALGRGPSKERQLELIESIWNYDQPVENNLFLININIGLSCILTVDECVGKYSGVIPISPLIDHQIIEYVASINFGERWKIPKYLFRESMKGILHEKIRMRGDKMGFPIPLNIWKWPMLNSLLLSLKKRGLIEVNLEKYKIMSRQTWALCNLELICRGLENE